MEPRPVSDDRARPLISPVVDARWGGSGLVLLAVGLAVPGVLADGWWGAAVIAVMATCVGGAQWLFLYRAWSRPTNVFAAPSDVAAEPADRTRRRSLVRLALLGPAMIMGAAIAEALGAQGWTLFAGSAVGTGVVQLALARRLRQWERDHHARLLRGRARTTGAGLAAAPPTLFAATG